MPVYVAGMLTHVSHIAEAVKFFHCVNSFVKYPLRCIKLNLQLTYNLILTRLQILYRDSKKKTASFAGYRFNPDFPTMQLNNFFTMSQANS